MHMNTWYETTRNNHITTINKPQQNWVQCKKIWKNIYRSDVKVTFEIYGHLQCLHFLYFIPNKTTSINVYTSFIPNKTTSINVYTSFISNKITSINVYTSFIPNKTTFIKYSLTQWISKLPGSFEIHWVRQSGLGYSYSVLVLAVLEYWISCTHTVLVLVSSKVKVLVLVLVDKYSGTRTSTGTSTDILWYICDVRVKTIIPLK